MELIEGLDYVNIKPSAVLIINDKLVDWTPEDARNRHGVIEKKIHSKYLNTFFEIKAKKPYPTRRRILISGYLEEGLKLSGTQQIWAWLDDLKIFTYRDGSMVEHKSPKKTQIRKRNVEDGIQEVVVMGVDKNRWRDLRR